LFSRCLLSIAARLLFQFDYVHLFHDSAIQACLIALAAPSIDTAKLVNIFHTTKYFDKIFQNIFILFFRGISGHIYGIKNGTSGHIYGVKNGISGQKYC